MAVNHQLPRISAALYDLKTGDYIRRVPVGSRTTWDRVINAPGTFTLELPRSTRSRLSEVHEIAKPWEVAVAITRGRRVLQAGPVVRRPWNRSLELKGGGYWKYLEKRLVLNHALSRMTIDGEILIDEENPAPEWVLNLRGTYVDIAAAVLAETAKWEAMPLDLPARTGPNIYERNYYGYDLASVATRLSQLTGVENGPELRFDPYLRPDGGVQWRLEGDREIVDNVWEWNTAIPGQGVTVSGLDDDGEEMTNDGWGQGGRNDDLLLMTRSIGDRVRKMPLLQQALTSHSSVSELETLRGHTRGMVRRSMNTYGQVQLEVPVRNDVQVGDWVDLRTEMKILGRTFLSLKVVGVSGGVGDRQKIDCRVRYEE